ncbi:MAG TPA: AAA family ATPase, partial [Dissulfurispiraceae bacterium]|nr:AAA family ATPase [Dissulfurispiraceae bacterium]
MLSELRIRNFTIISDLAVHFSGGLTVLSGETGAGKSIIVDAISMLLGDKASPEVIRTGAAEAQLSAVFAADTRDIADAFGISADDELLIRRTVPAHGKSRSFLNDVPFSIPSLVRVGASLVSIHGQHEQQDLLKREMHLAYLDRLAGLEANAADVRDKYDALVAARAEHDRMQQRMQERAQRIDYLRFQIAEIDASAVQPGEQNQLEEERRVLMNASRLQESSALAYDMLYDAEGSCIDTLGTVETKAAEISQVDPRASETLQLICSAHSQLKDAAAALRNLRDGYDADPGRLDVVENRLETLRTMEKKYGSGYEAISAFRTAAIDELAALEKIEERVQEGSE